MSLGEPERELLYEPMSKYALEPTEVKDEDLGQDNGQPEDRVLTDEGCGRAPEISH